MGLDLISFLAIAVISIWYTINKRVAGSTLAEPKQLFEEVWAARLSNSPEYATRLGIHEYDEHLTDLTETAILARRDQALGFIARAEALLKDQTTKDNDRLNLRILVEAYNPYVDRINNQSDYFQINAVYGFHRTMNKLFEAMPLDTLSGYETMLKRLQKIPPYIDQVIDLMKNGVKRGYVYHQLSMNNFNSSLTKKNYLVTNPTDSVFYKIFTAKFPATFTEQEKKNLQDRCHKIVKDKVTPAFEKLAYYITKKYTTRPKEAVSSIPNGKAYYDHCIKYYTSTNLTAQEIHNIGLKEVDRIGDEMRKVINQLGHENMTTKEFSEMIRDDPNNYHKTTEEVLAEFRRLNNEVIPPKLGDLFTTVNQASKTFTIEGDPVATSAYYILGSIDGTKPGTFFVPTFNIRPKYSMMTLSLHEVSPGHHFHFSYFSNFKELPKFIRGLRQTFFIEGWALYAEYLGFELGLYTDPLDAFGHLTAEMFRACRLVVDTGLHALNWTPKQAIDYMFNKVAKLRATLKKEVYRYITNPGQALAYKMGEIKIKEMRKKAETKLVTKFDVKGFHDEILMSYGFSMDSLEEKIDEWIKKKIQPPS